MEQAKIWHSISINDVFKGLETSEKGLASSTAKERLAKYGTNELKQERRRTALHIFLEQFNSFLIWILFGAVAISIYESEYADAIVIAIILVLNAILGFIQEYNAEKSLEALKKLSSLKSTVIRDGKEQIIDSKELVPGDIVLIEEGAKIPADCRLIESKNLATQEAALTGESNTVAKSQGELPSDALLAEMTNMLFAGTTVVRGRGKAVVVETGLSTQIGKIATMINEMEEIQTPLQKNMEILGKQIGIIVIIICFAILAVGYFFNGMPFETIFLASVSLAVAAIPEGLPAVVTISLALGVKRMVKKNSLIRKLSSVETLGSTTVICTDKTGTLTHNEMTVRKIFVNNKIIDVSGQGYDAKGGFFSDGKNVDIEEIKQILLIGALCNNAKFSEAEELAIGDPTELALLVSAAKAGISTKGYIREDEILFDSRRKCMSTVNRKGKERFIFTKGAPEVVLGMCTSIHEKGRVRKITKKDINVLLARNREFASSALRVLGFAYRKLGVREKAEEKGLVFVGLQAMIDPPRAEAKIAIEKCKTAGIKVVMITGDNELTARAIANELGIEGRYITGRELDSINLSDMVDDIAIYARVNPEHKMRIVEALQAKGHVVAMTGDGVNDAPAIKKADIGIAMGVTGTDVAKESSKMVLLDDNFVSIVNAVEEGRGIYNNIRKFVYYLLSCNFGEVLTVFIAILLGFSYLPVAALQILWMNLVTDGFPALALGIDPIEKDVMQKKPRRRSDGIVNARVILRMLSIGAVMMAGTLILFHFYLQHGIKYAQTVAFTTLVVFQLLNALNTHCERTVFSKQLFDNKFLLMGVLGSFFLQVIVIYGPLEKIFSTVALTLFDWLIILGVCSSIILIEEVRKLLSKRVPSWQS
ncbi:MAG: calcium-translocating P-type ATPase, SERCA-type [Candidatus Woesearchaeota archaeon]